MIIRDVSEESADGKARDLQSGRSGKNGIRGSDTTTDGIRVQVRTMYAAPASGPETLYFDVPGTDRARTTLQVVFPRNHYVTSSEFQLLKAAAWLVAATLEFEHASVVGGNAEPSKTATAFTTPKAMVAEAVA